jgi:hypothetical protein
MELAGQVLNKNAVAVMPKNQWGLVQLSDCRRLPGAKSGDPNSYVFGMAANSPARTVVNTENPHSAVRIPMYNVTLR